MKKGFIISIIVGIILFTGTMAIISINAYLNRPKNVFEEIRENEIKSIYLDGNYVDGDYRSEIMRNSLILVNNIKDVEPSVEETIGNSFIRENYINKKIPKNIKISLSVTALKNEIYFDIDYGQGFDVAYSYEPGSLKEGVYSNTKAGFINSYSKNKKLLKEKNIDIDKLILRSRKIFFKIFLKEWFQKNKNSDFSSKDYGKVKVELLKIKDKE